MKRSFTLLLFSWCLLFSSLAGIAQGEPFALTVLNTKPGSGNYALAHPFDIVYGPDDHLYITEKEGRILRVDTGTGVRQILLDIRGQVSISVSRDGSGAATGISQNGMLGLALHPNFGKGTGQDSIFVAYSNPANSIRIVRYRYNAGPATLTDPTTIIQGIPAGGDHSTGRMIIGADNKLYYSCGDLGHNQFGNKCVEIRSQMAPTAAQLSASNYTNYSGKILRMNLDGSIPADNPIWGGVRSHIYTMGHRNAQGLVWQTDPSGGFTPRVQTPGGKLFSSEHGPCSDDEINLIESGKNYGWPFIAGDTDNVNYQYVKWVSSPNCGTTSFRENPYFVPTGATVTQETAAPDSIKLKFRKPLKPVFTTCGTRPTTQCLVTGQDWLRFPTIAPSSIEFYNLSFGKGIPDWYPSLLVTTLRTGTVYRFKMNAAMDAIISDSIPYFKSINRFRDIALSPDGRIFLVTDSIGSTSGPSGQNQTNLTNKGAIMVYTYTGAILPIGDRPTVGLPEVVVRTYPNPATDIINVELRRLAHLPVRYHVYDMAGKLVLQNTSNKTSFHIHVDELKRGMYILALYNGYGIELKKEKIVLQ
jgi:PQQ-dependent dehydrogenase (s-GDH family)